MAMSEDSEPLKKTGDGDGGEDTQIVKSRTKITSDESRVTEESKIDVYVWRGSSVKLSWFRDYSKNVAC